MQKDPRWPPGEDESLTQQGLPASCTCVCKGTQRGAVGLPALRSPTKVSRR